MQADFWKDKYPSSVPFTINVEAYDSVLDVFHESCQRFGDKPAFSNMGRTITYRELDQYSAAFAAYLQNHTDLKPGDRIVYRGRSLDVVSAAEWRAKDVGSKANCPACHVDANKGYFEDD